MKKNMLLMLAALMLLSMLTMASAEHVHVWNNWQDMNDGASHAATCPEDGVTQRTRHNTYSATVNGASLRVCSICGTGSNLTAPFALIEGATAVPTAENPLEQMGNLIVRGLANPTALDAKIVYAFTLTYEYRGGMATFRNTADVTIPLGVELPEGWKLVQVNPATGDDSTYSPETWIDTVAAYADQVLSLTTRTPGLYLILAP